MKEVVGEVATILACSDDAQSRERTLDDLMTGRQIVRRFGQVVPYRLTSSERAAFEQAKADGYLMTTARLNLRNAFWRYCEIRKRPYIRVRVHRVYADVSMDLFTQLADLSPGAIERAEKILAQFSARGALLSVGPGYIASDKVPLDRASTLARALLALWQEDRALAFASGGGA